MNSLSEIRFEIRRHLYTDETECVETLLSANQIDKSCSDKILSDARQLVERSRVNRHGSGTLDAFLQEFGLTNKEGVALMCLAESLLRVPDTETADKLIVEKISTGDWKKHLGHSNSIFVNVSTWALMLTGKIIHIEEFGKDNHWYEGMLNRIGEPIIRNALLQAMKILGGQYVLGRTVSEAMENGRKENTPETRFSFDMLGEGARTKKDAKKYLEAYMSAIHILGKESGDKDVTRSNGISIKLSALHPRYEALKYDRVMNELYPTLVKLAMTAKKYNIGLNIDAEEASRLDISLTLFERLAKEECLAGWEGLGFVLQAYQKRSTFVAEWLITLAKETKRKIMVRLVKGAYWDSEIKHAQESGFDDYPVYTRKVNTDLSYQICAQILLGAQHYIFPQFATHNAHTIACIKHLAKNKSYEFQRLHGMGHVLFEELNRDSEEPYPVRVYAPVGAHKDLLPYLMRRLLENGANSSFVNRFLDDSTPVEDLIRDVVYVAEHNKAYRHPKIPMPGQIFMNSDFPRKNSKGIDLNDCSISNSLLKEIQIHNEKEHVGGAIINGEKITGEEPVYSPAGNNLVGYSYNATQVDVDNAFCVAREAQASWNSLGGDRRAEILEAIACSIEAHNAELLHLIIYEAGRTIGDSINELREAVDFCRYYALLARKHFSEPIQLPGPTGEVNELSLHGRGVFVCISPWNFPLAIFTGQIVAALAAGNCVIAKPAEQTPLIASRTIELMHLSGVPHDVLHLIAGGGAVGASLVKDKNVSGVAFTGSTETAKNIQRSLACSDGAIIPFIAETGGINTMIVDSTALLEQVVDDVISSAFLSAGQRCSSLRVLYIQNDIWDELILMLIGACEELNVSEPWKLDTDIGPVIDNAARKGLQTHIERMRKEAKILYQHPINKLPAEGTYIGPNIFQINLLACLKKEVFGPVLHVIKYEASKLDDVLNDINDCKYGLTLGVHTRLTSRSRYIFSKVNVGNTYVNRNMVGAVVGVNPFGGQGLSGTGPKAGGPHYLFRFSQEKNLTVNTVATGGNASLLSLGL